MATEIIRIGKTVIEKEVPDPPKPTLQLQQGPLPEEEVKPRRKRLQQDD